MKRFTHSLTVMGIVTQVNAEEGAFSLRCRSGDVYQVSVGKTTTFPVLRNLDELDRDRVRNPEGFDSSPPHMVRKYVWPNALLTVQGIYQENEGTSLLEARQVSLLHSKRDGYLFEDTHWWLTQIARLADEWLDDLFGDKRTYMLDDFARLYRTNLNIVGLPTDDNIQENATLSRLIYGLSSAYLLTGKERYLLAARAGVQYQRETFRMLSHDGRHCFWAFGKRKLKYGSELIEYSLNHDDYGTIPLYEQIYALAGLAQYYRITADWEVLEDIKRTVNAFNRFYLDSRENSPQFPGVGGYFSHLDYGTVRPDEPKLDADPSHPNCSRKNWNSIGDHIPAYLVNLILALDPLPQDRFKPQHLGEFLGDCRKMLDDTSRLIVEKFPDTDANIPYVNERFFANWRPDKKWGWQQDRAIIGHNLKIAWNLTRVANYYHYIGRGADAAPLMQLANKLAKSMAEVGIDQIRGGCFDAVERQPKNGLPVEFAWGNTKDFWQQEQGILAYLILHGYTGDKEYLQLAREMMAFWNLFFLDHDNRGIFFRVTDDGMPVIQGGYGSKAGHAVAGYHAFELNYLAHLYIRMYVKGEEGGANEFCLYFKPDRNTQQRSINVLPDFVQPGTLTVKDITVDGVKRATVDPDNFQIELDASEVGGSEVAVVFNVERHGRS
ncbi:MAG: AGE family epimerase/isomerase [Chloroflexi bacterium]|nr:AGE family epimerase/isomerase [Chloroflexota bacterium]